MAYTFAVETSVQAPLTRIGFRRDVRLFLTGLVGFLVVLIFTLLLLLRANLSSREESLHRSQQMIADVAAESVNRTSAGLSDQGAQLLFLRGRFGIAGLEIVRRDGGRVVSGARSGQFDEVTRLVGPGTLLLRFDSSQRREAHRDFLLTAAICIAAASLGASLLLFYLPRITRPIEAMLDHARELGAPGDQEETAYLIDTFRNSIATLKTQEAELKQLHDREKTRADDLERVTAALTRSLTSGLIAVDAEGLILEMNSAGRDILRIDPAALVNGGRLETVVPLTRFRGALQDSFLEQSAVSRIEIEDVHPDGDAVSIGLTTVPLRNEFETFLGFLALFTDLTPIRNLENRVQDMTTLAQLGEISAGIAHEFRSSLSTILGYTRLARKGGVGEVAEGRLASAEKEASLL
ncbi:MAG: PAS domain-containing protein, partial [Thermoanaerobaculia bacterium]